MKCLIGGDFHLTEKRPANRIDDYVETEFRKLNWMFNLAMDRGCSALLQPADFTDTPNPSFDFFSRLLFGLKTWTMNGLEIFTTYGQHDLRYRDMRNTALRALSIGCHNLFADLTGCYDLNEGPVVIQTCGWEEDIPEPVKGKFNILIIHKMIVDEKLWAEQDHFEYGNSFLKDHKFDLIVSGDNHKAFHCHYKGRYLFNCGSMMRSTIAQIEHKPHVVIFDTDNPSAFEIIPIPIDPAQDVFNFDEIVAREERNEKLDAFVDGLSEHKEMGLSFEDNLAMYIEKNEIDKEVHDLIKRGMRG